MAKLKVHNPSKAKLKTSGYIGVPTGEEVLTENHIWYNVRDDARVYTDIPDPELEDIIIDNNGTYRASTYNVDGFKNVYVDLLFDELEATPSTELQRFTPNQQVGFRGFDEVRVLPTPLEHGFATPSDSQVTYTPESPNIGFSDFTVAATPEPVLQSKTVTPPLHNNP